MNIVYLDISVKNFSGRFTSQAKASNVGTQILMKVPKWNLTTVRLTGTLFSITEFLKILSIALDSQWTWETITMHMNATKPYDPVMKAPHWKNRGLMENRELL